MPACRFGASVRRLWRKDQDERRREECQGRGFPRPAATNLAYDGLRYWRHAFLLSLRTRENLRTRIHLNAHFLEYGMSLPAPRKGFGLDRATLLADDIHRYIGDHGPDPSTRMALGSLDAHLAFNAGAAIDLAPLAESVAAASEADARPDGSLKGGTGTVRGKDIRRRAGIDFLDFAQARHGVRAYAPRPVPIASIPTGNCPASAIRAGWMAACSR